MPTDPFEEIALVYCAAMQAVHAWQGLTQPCPDLDPAMQRLQDLLQRFCEEAEAAERQRDADA